MHFRVKWLGERVVAFALNALIACVFSGCDGAIHRTIATQIPLVPHAEIERVRGAAVRAALDRSSTATAIARQQRRHPRGSCRSALPSTPVTVTAQVAFHGKRADGSAERWHVQSAWRRDADGDVSRERTVRSQLPDGREVERSFSVRVVAGRSYAAIDGRYADTTQEPRVAAAAADAAFEDIDDLLSDLSWNDGWRRRGPPLCGARVDRGLPAADAAFVQWRYDGRDGWVRYREGPRRLTVAFEEHIRTGADDIVAPSTLWSIDADPSFEAVAAFADAGRAAGWWTDLPEPTPLPTPTDSHSTP
jgi:hypothetical protein